MTWIQINREINEIAIILRETITKLKSFEIVGKNFGIKNSAGEGWSLWSIWDRLLNLDENIFTISLDWEGGRAKKYGEN